MSKNPRGNFIQGVCSSGKRAYLTRRSAEAVAKRLRSQGNKRTVSYFCEECNRHHVGHLRISG